MPDWNELVAHFFLMSDPDGDYDHHAPAEVSPESMRELESKLSVDLPEEFYDFYRHFNGVGLVARDDAAIPLFLRPVEEIPSYVDECRAKFAATHPEEAACYFPFIDWWNGNSSGYLLDRAGELHPFLCTFCHERYAHETGQALDEFMEPHANSIAELLWPEEA